MSKKNVTAETIELLHIDTVRMRQSYEPRDQSAKHAGAGPESWYVYFGVLPPEVITCCVKTDTGEEIHQWGELSPPELDTMAVPPWRRGAWQKQLFKKVRRAIRADRRRQTARS